jgi:hypothetical protein
MKSKVFQKSMVRIALFNVENDALGKAAGEISDALLQIQNFEHILTSEVKVIYSNS